MSQTQFVINELPTLTFTATYVDGWLDIKARDHAGVVRSSSGCAVTGDPVPVAAPSEVEGEETS